MSEKKVSLLNKTAPVSRCLTFEFETEERERHQLSGCSYDFFSFIGIPGLTRDPKLLEALLCSRSTRPGFAFAAGEPSISSSDLFSTWRSLSNRNRIVGKKVAETATRTHREIHTNDQAKKVIPFVS